MSAFDIFSLKGKISVVTGGAGLLGSAVVEALAKSGSEVIVVDINDAKRKYEGMKIRYEKRDTADIGKIKDLVADLDEKYGPIDIWINSAYPRTDDWSDRLEKIKPDSWQRNIDMHLNSYCILSNEAAKLMAARKKGCIINIASVYGIIAPDFSLYEGTEMTTPAAYSAIKGGIIAYSRYLASYYGKTGVRVNVISPGGILNKQPDKFLKRYSQKTILGRMAAAEEVAWPVVFLASEAASYITGAVLMVDGGLTVI